MKTRTIALCGALVVAVAIAISVRSRGSAGVELGPELPTANERAPAVEVPSKESIARTSETPTMLPMSAADIENAPAWSVSGKVVNLRGEGLAGVAVVQHGSGVVLDRTDTEGRFHLSARLGSLLSIESDDYLVLGRGVVKQDGESVARAVIVASPSVTIDGSVTDRAARPVVGARLVTRASNQEVLRAAKASDWTEPVRSGENGVTGELGLFSLAPVPSGSELWISAAGFEPWVGVVPQGGAQGWQVQLEARTFVGDCISGRVVATHTDAPVEGAHVAIGGVAVCTSADGMFVLDLGAPGVVPSGEGPVRNLLIVKRGFQAAVLPVRVDCPTAGLRIGLDPPLPPIRGRVVDVAGGAVAGARVYLGDCQLAGLIGDTPGASYFVSAEELLGGPRVITDAAGEFIIEGLSDRDYSLVALSTEALCSAAVRGIRPGGTATIVVAANTLRRIRGRMLDTVGRGVGGVTVQAAYSARWSDEAYGIYELAYGPSLVTDETGEFEFREIGRSNIVLCVLGSNVVRQMVPIEAGDDATIAITVMQRCVVTLELAPGVAPCRVQALDDKMKLTPIQVRSGKSVSQTEEITVSSDMSVDMQENVQWVRIRRDSAEDVPVSFMPGRDNRLTIR